MNNLLDSEKKKIELLINKARDVLMKMISSLYQHIVKFNGEVANLNGNLAYLTKEINDLKQKRIENKCVHVVSDILGS